MKSICVFCGSNSGNDPAYQTAAVDLGGALVDRGLDLVYGGASIGLMGAIADSVLAAGGRVQGVIPESLRNLEIAHKKLTKLHTVNTMHERKALMADLSDGFIALPGGAGTLEEVLEIWTWAQLGHHHKPIGFLNISNYFDKLLNFFDHQVEEKFVRSAHRHMVVVESEPVAMLERFANYRAPQVTKWIAPDER